MAKKNSSKTATQTSISNSQPRIQVLSGWQGVNWATVPYDTDYKEAIRDEEEWRGRGQSDSKPNYLALQNNLITNPNGSIETVYEPISLNEAPTGTTLTGIVCMYKDYIIAVAQNNSGEENIYKVKVPTINTSYVPGSSQKPWTLNNWSDAIPMIDKNSYVKKKRKIISLNVFGNKLIALCKYDNSFGEMFDGDIDTLETIGISNAKEVPNPATLSDTYNMLSPTKQGWEAGLTDVIRLTFKAIWTNKYGATLATRNPKDASGNYLNTISVPDGPDSFTSRKYVSLSGVIPSGYDITGVDLYCSQNESTDNIFVGHVNIPAGSTGWSFNWLGSLMDTTQWTTSMLTIPTMNTTRGVDACYCDQYDGRLYFYGGTDSDRLYIGGNPGNELSVATGYGGAFLDIEPGSGYEIRKVLKFKTYNGANIITLLTYHPNTNKAGRYNILETNITVTNEYATKGYDTERVDSVVGCSSYYGADTFIDGLYAVNRYGLAFTTKQQENTNNLKVMYCSQSIDPIFHSMLGKDISNSRLLAIKDTIFLAFSDTSNKVYTNAAYDTQLDNVIFAYDTGAKAWYTYTLALEDSLYNNIRHIFHVDSENFWEGIGIVRSNNISMIPVTGADYDNYYLTNGKPIDNKPSFTTFFATHEVTGRSPVTNITYVDQLEFRFDYLCSPEGLTFWVEGYDYYGRHFKIDKKVVYDTMQRQTTVYLIVRKYVEGISIYIKGKAHYRLTHINMKAFQKQNRIGSHFGFDTRSKYKGHHGNEYHEHHKIKSYNDLKYLLLSS